MSDLKHHPTRRHDYDDQSLAGMLAEIGHLLLLLLLKSVKRVWQHVRRGLRLLLKIVCKGLLWLIDSGILCARRWQRFWNDRSTQEKVGRVRELTLAAWQGLAKAGRWIATNSVKAGRWTAVNGVRAGRWAVTRGVRGLRWLCVHLVQWIWLFCKGVGWTVVHLRGAAGVAWQGLCAGAVWLRARLGDMAASLRRRRRRLRAARLLFHRRGGVRGLLFRWGLRLKQSIYDSIEERDDGAAVAAREEDEDEEDEVVEDEEEALFKRVEQAGGGKVHTYGRGFYQALKRIVEEE